jgi:aminoglycoside phosphotransferase (APT) family kinase protein
MLQTHVPGTNGEDLPSQRSTIWLTLGRYAKRIHSARPSGLGETLESFNVGNAVAEWKRFVSYNIASLTQDDELIRVNVYCPDQADQIREWFSTLQTREFTFGLSHGDLSPRNTVVAETGQVTLLDWGSAETHIVPHYDLRYLAHQSNPVEPDMWAFLEGYGMDAADYGRLLPELRVFKLLKAFDLTRWAIARCPEVIPEKVTWARATLQEILTEL